MTRAVLGLGANLGDARGALAGAVRDLAATPGVSVVGVSGLWRTAPVGGPEQPDYCNAVVLVETDLDAEALLALGQRLEAAAGRTRDVRWGPRTLDVDLLDMAGVRRDEPGLTVPHPRAHERAFVLVPWASVDPTWLLAPAASEAAPVASWAAAVVEAEGEDQPLALVADGTWWA